VSLFETRQKKLLILEVIANFMQQNPSSETVASQLVKECPTFHGMQRFNAMFNRACHFPYPEPDQATP